MLLSATTACTGQLLWKLFARDGSILLVFLGFILYGSGAVLMILALRYGELSILHPMMSAGYVLSLVLGAVVLKEQINITKILGVVIIIVGLVFLSMSGKNDGE